MDKRNLFEQMNESAYENSTNPFDSLYVVSEGDSFTESELTYTEPTSVKMPHNMTQAEIEEWRHRLELEEEMNPFNEPVEPENINLPSEEPLPDEALRSELPPEEGLGGNGGEIPSDLPPEEAEHEEIIDTVETLSAKIDKLAAKLDAITSAL
jgi:hypothetical protein